jgi:hypothetical protein
MSTHAHDKRGWIGVDLDGTLAHYEGFKGPKIIGAPIPLMVERVKGWLAEGITVKIFTARVWKPEVAATYEDALRCEQAIDARMAIQTWCREHLGVELEVTCTKDYSMWQLWDDRAVQVEMNTGVAFVHPTAAKAAAP